MKTKFFFFLAMLLMSSVGAFAQSETKTPLKGDLNEDGEVNAADVVVLVDIIMKKDVDPNKYYWYIGTENPTSISNVQTDNTKPGWHEIGTTLSGFILDTNRNLITISDTDRKPYYVVIPDGLHIYDAFGMNIETRSFTEQTCNIPGYKAFRNKPSQTFDGVWEVAGLIIKGDDSDNKFYWYIGIDLPTSISNLQTDNTKPGWHEIGTSLSGFVLDTNDESNEVILNTENVRYHYYIVIPNGLGMHDALGTNLETDGEYIEVECNISGYKAYQYIIGRGARTVTGIILKEDPNYKLYWYIGVENPTSISDIETDTKKAGWHEIGSSLSGFVLDTNRNIVTISDTDRKPYYVVIPNDLHIYNALNMNIEDISFVPQSCSIPGYKAFKNKPSQLFDGVWDVSGLILKQ